MAEKTRLLVIDDDAALRDLFRLTMEAEGFAVEEAEDGAVGLEKARALKPHLIVLDLMMPKLSGTEVIRRLQTLGLESIPIVIITAYGPAANEEILRNEPNVVEFLAKPLRYKELAARIRRFTSGAGAA